MNKTIEKTKVELQALMLQAEYTKDVFGHYHSPKGNIRYKFGKRNLRAEKVYRDSEGKKRYIRISSAPYSKLTVKEGKIYGMKKGI